MICNIIYVKSSQKSCDSEIYVGVDYTNYHRNSIVRNVSVLFDFAQFFARAGECSLGGISMLKI